MLTFQLISPHSATSKKNDISSYSYQQAKRKIISKFHSSSPSVTSQAKENASKNISPPSFSLWATKKFLVCSCLQQNLPPSPKLISHPKISLKPNHPSCSLPLKLNEYLYKISPPQYLSHTLLHNNFNFFQNILDMCHHSIAALEPLMWFPNSPLGCSTWLLESPPSGKR